MKIVVSSVSFSKSSLLRKELLKVFPSAVFNEKGSLSRKELYELTKDASALIAGAEKIDALFLKNCPNLQIISKYGVGMDNIDFNACKKNGVVVKWTEGVNKLSVAEITVGFMIALSRNLFQTAFQLKEGVWNKNGGTQLSNKTVGIIGVGNIGKEVVRLLKPFGCKILVNDLVLQDAYYNKNHLVKSTKDRLFKQADFITIHTPLTPKTRHLVNFRTLNKMKPTAFLINTARGSIIKQQDLKKALQQKIIAGAALDVYEEEPLQDSELFRLSNLICTPHIGGNSMEAVEAMGFSAIGHLKAFFRKSKQ